MSQQLHCLRKFSPTSKAIKSSKEVRHLLPQCRWFLITTIGPLSKSLPRRPTLLKSSPDAVAFNVVRWGFASVYDHQAPLELLYLLVYYVVFSGSALLFIVMITKLDLGLVTKFGRFPKGLIAVFRPCVGNFKGAYLLNYGKFSQALRLPPGTTAASIRAGLSDGLLTITWPRIIKAETSQNLHPAQISQNE
ncbi:hypothetical protein B0H10DRAFT_1953953 [Mycena sp. CBHHK59/15]|nr:hypothetical protein B0H10DRAFT_1953953 [Mycena sp. CBHHK59/15]